MSRDLKNWYKTEFIKKFLIDKTLLIKQSQIKSCVIGKKKRQIVDR